MEKPLTENKLNAGVLSAVEDRIVALSLQNPEYSAKRLLWLLKREQVDISISSISKILKRQGLQNREARLERIKVKKAVEALRIKAGNPAQQRQERPEKVSSGHALPVSRTHVRIGFRSSWALTAANIMLLALLVYSGFSAVQSIRRNMIEPNTFLATTFSLSDHVAITTESNEQQPLMAYRAIWERDLFDASSQKATTNSEIAIEKLSPAKKDLGLKLVGTVVAEDPRMSRAFIDNKKSGHQEVYGEGDKTGEIRIKKVLRNRVVITTAEGDRLLLAELGVGTGPSSQTTIASPSTESKLSVGGQMSTGNQVYPQQVAGRRKPGRSYTLARKEVQGLLPSIDELEHQLKITPYVKDDQPAGFMISGIPRQSILREMGIRNGIAIMGVNDEAIAGPEQEADFFQTLQNGGKMIVKAKIGKGVRRRTRYLHLNIN